MPVPAQWAQTEVVASNSADPPDLNTGAVMLQPVLEAPFYRTIVLVLLHIDEIDHDQTGEIAETQLARHFLRRFHIGLERSFLDIVFAGRPA